MNYAKGLFIEMPSEKAKAFVDRKISIKVEPFIEWCQENVGESGYINIDVKKSQKEQGKLYACLNEYKKAEKKVEESIEETTDDVPF